MILVFLGYGLTSKKIVAVALTAAMCLGLSMTAFAKEEDEFTIKGWESEDFMRGTPTGYGIGPQVNADGSVGMGAFVCDGARDKNGNRVETNWNRISEEAWETINDEGKVAKIFADNGYKFDTKTTDFVPLASGKIAFPNGVPEGGAIVTFTAAELGAQSANVQPGDTMFVMQETYAGSGVWEVYTGTVTDQMEVSFNIPRNGALVLVKVLSNGEVVTIDGTTGEIVDRIPNGTVTTPSGQTSTSNPASAGTSPKTGEF